MCVTKFQRSTRGAGSFTVFAKVEFRGETLGESSRHELLEGTSHVNMNLNVSYPCKIANSMAVEGIMRNPLLGKAQCSAASARRLYWLDSRYCSGISDQLF